MHLRELLDAAAGRPGLTDLEVVAVDAALDAEVSGVTHDSRAVGVGTVFCCVPGEHVDGHDFAVAAAAAGAVALVCERRLDVGVPELRVGSTRAAMGPLAAAFHGDPSLELDVVGVTGTNGKTTTTHLLRAILDTAGRPCGLIGTLTGTRTTPAAPDLQATLADFLAGGKRAVAMEVSSHALVQHRVDGTRFAVSVFTNLSPDHLDYHATMGAYFQAKARLFDPDLSDRAVVCLDDPHGRLLRDAALVPTVGYSLADATDVELHPTGSRFRWRGVEVGVALAGRFNVSNALAAATAAAELGVDSEAIAAGLATAEPVPGRFELVVAGQDFTVAVDYAHTPDGIEAVLAAARELTGGPPAGPEGGRGRVIIVFGCGGDRDRSKRPGMGQAAAQGADRVVLTSDNPRSESPSAIIDAVRSGITDDTELLVEPDRRAAIAAAVATARAGDVVVVAGKGHETTQDHGDTVVAFDDREVTRAALEELAGLQGRRR